MTEKKRKITRFKNKAIRTSKVKVKVHFASENTLLLRRNLKNEL